MATSEIKRKYTATSALVISVANLAPSTVGVGQQCTLIDNSVSRYGKVHLYGQIKLGTSPTPGFIYVHLIKSDGSSHTTDGAGGTNAGFTVLNALLLGAFKTKASPSTGDIVQFDLEFLDPGPMWGIAVWQSTGVNLDATAENHSIYWVGEDEEAQ
jgi:hypothetical protein